MTIRTDTRVPAMNDVRVLVHICRVHFVIDVGFKHAVFSLRSHRGCNVSAHNRTTTGFLHTAIFEMVTKRNTLG